MKSYVVVCVAILGSMAVSPRATGQSRAPANAEAITAERLRAYLSFIASDETAGRATPSRGLDITAQFIASHLQSFGLRPGGSDASWFQRIPLRRTRLDSTATWAELGGRRYQLGQDFIVNIVPGTFEGPMVYVGHGWVIKSKNIDAYAGLDVRDKIVVVAEGGLPAGLTRADLRGPQGDDWEPPQMAMRRRGAKVMITVPSFQPLLEWNAGLRSGTQDGIISEEGTTLRPPIPVLRPSLALFQALLSGEQLSARDLFNRVAAGDPPSSFALNANKRLTLQVTERIDPLRTQNVIGMIEGSDPVLKTEYVVISAHYDHLGIGPRVNGDSIYNGADDDGSGTAAVLAIAQAFAGGIRPKRSVLFIWHAGEEQFRMGSRYFVAHPTVPLTQIVANLNIDMIGRTRTASTDTTKWTVVRPGEVYVVGSRRLSSELGEVSEQVNRHYLRLAFNYRFDAPEEPTQLFLRSDHYSYFEQGIPVIFYYAGEQEDFHQPSDSFDKIDYANLEKIARTVYVTALELANRARRPRLDR